MNTDGTTLFRADFQCPRTKYGVPSPSCGVGDEIDIRLSGQAQQTAVGNFSFASLPIKAQISSNASGFHLILSTHPYRGMKAFFNTSSALYAPRQDEGHMPFLSDFSFSTTSSGAMMSASPAYVTMALAECSACKPGLCLPWFLREIASVLLKVESQCGA